MVFSLDHRTERFCELNRDWAFLKKKLKREREVLPYRYRENLEGLNPEELKSGGELI